MTYEICIRWNVSDVIDRAKERGIKLERKAASDILELLYKNHDANVGINWDVIDQTTDLYRGA